MLSESGKKLHHFMAVMASQFCSETLEVPSQLGNLHGTFILIMTVLTFFSAAVATMENILVTYAIWKSSSTSQNFRIVSPAKPGFVGFSSGLAVIMFVVITAVISANNALFFVRCLRCLL